MSTEQNKMCIVSEENETTSKYSQVMSLDDYEDTPVFTLRENATRIQFSKPALSACIVTPMDGRSDKEYLMDTI